MGQCANAEVIVCDWWSSGTLFGLDNGALIVAPLFHCAALISYLYSIGLSAKNQSEI